MADRPAKTGPAPGPRPRLAVIEGFAGRRSAIPFALLILAVLGIGLVALLMLNTAMDEDSVRMQQAQQRQAALTDREQQLSQQLSGLSAPSALASQAAVLGLVPNPQPAFINPTTGAVLGTASPAPTPSPVPTPTPTQTPSGTPSGSPSATGSGTPGPTGTATGASNTPDAAIAPSQAAVLVGTSSASAGPVSGAASSAPPAPSQPSSMPAPPPSSLQPAGSPR
jgi:hypothetical protein